MKRSFVRDIDYFEIGILDFSEYVSEDTRVLSPRPNRNFDRKTSHWWDLSVFDELYLYKYDLVNDENQFKNDDNVFPPPSD